MANEWRWVGQSSQRTIDRINGYVRLLGLLKTGLVRMSQSDRLTKALARVLEDPDEHGNYTLETTEKIRLSELDAKDAKQEIDSDFPRLNETMALFLWSTLEAWIRDIFIGYYINIGNLVDNDTVSNIKISLHEYYNMDDYDRIDYVYDKLRWRGNMANKRGVDLFEEYMTIIGLSGTVQPAVRRALFELNELRNIILHRNGVCDRQAVQRCPWAGWIVNSELRINSEQASKYSSATSHYMTTVLNRILVIRQKEPVELTEFVEEGENTDDSTSEG